jgi:hypothetical protein
MCQGVAFEIRATAGEFCRTSLPPASALLSALERLVEHAHQTIAPLERRTFSLGKRLLPWRPARLLDYLSRNTRNFSVDENVTPIGLASARWVTLE